MTGLATAGPLLAWNYTGTWRVKGKWVRGSRNKCVYARSLDRYALAAEKSRLFHSSDVFSLTNDDASFRICSQKSRPSFFNTRLLPSLSEKNSTKKRAIAIEATTSFRLLELYLYSEVG